MISLDGVTQKTTVYSLPTQFYSKDATLCSAVATLLGLPFLVAAWYQFSGYNWTIILSVDSEKCGILPRRNLLHQTLKNSRLGMDSLDCTGIGSTFFCMFSSPLGICGDRVFQRLEKSDWMKGTRFLTLSGRVHAEWWGYPASSLPLVFSHIQRTRPVCATKILAVTWQSCSLTSTAALASEVSFVLKFRWKNVV